jgi:hypothetical protein
LKAAFSCDIVVLSSSGFTWVFQLCSGALAGTGVPRAPDRDGVPRHNLTGQNPTNSFRRLPKMIIQLIGRVLAVLLIPAFIVAYSSFTLRQYEKTDDKFEIATLKNIKRAGRDLKQAGVDDKTVQVLKYALENLQRDTQSYVQDRS